ncbi:hypothetical protein JXA56_04555 [Candidatus Micrarchaeota archaeon]|nr:hypothetical protein [Candidatus Micrarchaeota archaeon]
MTAQTLRQEQSTPPASPKALKHYFRGTIMRNTKEKFAASETILRQHLAEVKINEGRKNLFTSHGPYLLMENDILDAVSFQALSRTIASIELICKIAADSDLPAVKQKAIEKLRFNSGIVPVSNDR